MWWLLVVNLLLWHHVIASPDDDSDDDFGAGLIATMKDDANLDLPVDEEYEDLRAELMAYHTTLAKLASASTARRSMMTTPCWKLGGICINYKLCSGFRYLTEVAGCRNNLNVCCFTWNRYKVRDFKDQGITGLQFPWSKVNEYGRGRGIIEKEIVKPKSKKHIKVKKEKPEDINNDIEPEDTMQVVIKPEVLKHQLKMSKKKDLFSDETIKLGHDNHVSEDEIMIHAKKK